MRLLCNQRHQGATTELGLGGGGLVGWVGSRPLMGELASVAAPPGIAVYLLVFVNIGLAVAGRAFLPEEDRTPGTHPVVVMSYGCRQQTAAGGLTAGADSSNEIVE